MTRPWMASRTDVRATPNSWHSTRSAGSGVPGASWPVWIASASRWRISAETVRRDTGSKLVVWPFDWLDVRHLTV